MERAVVAPLLDGAPLGALRRVATSVSFERARRRRPRNRDASRAFGASMREGRDWTRQRVKRA